MVDHPPDDAASVTSPCSSASDVSPFEIGSERWAEAEKAAYEVIWRIQPTLSSEERRRRVIGYVQRLIRKNIGVELFPYGSVPLKTYLPDGDVDLTAFGGANAEDTLADEIKFVLEEEEKNRASEFSVRDVQLIRAEVKLVKCIVQNIVVDISLNQIGGLSTLCFLEQVDRHVGKDHLFKHSTILIKAWCYYESRILGAHHGLISTYGLEVMVLYIFNFFHSTLEGPLSVLYKFLDYFSKFDWETYCVSLKGPVRLSSFPNFVAEMPEDNVDHLLLNNDFLNSCKKSFSVPSGGVAIKSRAFQLKHLNIIDPLKESNNLGRSVSKGNFYRIRSAFSLGARKLGCTLLHRGDGLADELCKFFSNTIARHGCVERPEIPNLHLPPAFDGLAPVLPLSNSLEDVNGEARRICHNSNGEHKVLSDWIETPISGLKNNSTVVTTKPVFAPHLFFSKPAIGNEYPTNGGLDSNDDGEKNDSYFLSPGIHERQIASNNQLMIKNEAVTSMKSCFDFSGDYESYLRGLEYGRGCYEHASVVPSPPVPPPPGLPLFQIKTTWDNVLPSSQFHGNGFSGQHPNNLHPRSPVYAVPHVLIPAVSYGWDEMPKPRGTGTYFPNVSPQVYKSPTSKGRNQAPSTPQYNNSPRKSLFMESNILERRCHGKAQSDATLDNSLYNRSCDGNQPASPNGSVLVVALERDGAGGFEVQHGSKTSMLDRSKVQRPASSSPMPRPLPASVKEEDRIALRSSYHLKDEDDFPPLSV